MTDDPTGMVRLAARRTGNTPEYYGIYTFEAVAAAESPDGPTPWRCESCRWWEVIPDFALDPSGRHGMCLLAELQDSQTVAQEGPAKRKRFLADDGLATSKDYGCLEWQTAVVPAAEPWLKGAGGNDWRFPGVEIAHRDPVDLPDGGHRRGGTVYTYAAPEQANGMPSTPPWACRTCRWFDRTAVSTPARWDGRCSIVAKMDLIPAGDEPCVFLKAFAGEDGLETVAGFGCAMWNDERYEALPKRQWGDDT